MSKPVLQSVLPIVIPRNDDFEIAVFELCQSINRGIRRKGALKFEEKDLHSEVEVMANYKLETGRAGRHYVVSNAPTATLFYEFVVMAGRRPGPWTILEVDRLRHRPGHREGDIRPGPGAVLMHQGHRPDPIGNVLTWDVDEVEKFCDAIFT